MEGIHGQPSNRTDRLHRGRTTLLAFLMQGWGQLINQVVLILALLIFNSGGRPPYGEVATQYTFRISFAFIAIFLLFLIYIRVFKLKNTNQSFNASRKRGGVTGYDVTSFKLIMGHYWHRLFATSLCWFCNDFPCEYPTCQAPYLVAKPPRTHPELTYLDSFISRGATLTRNLFSLWQSNLPQRFFTTCNGW